MSLRIEVSASAYAEVANALRVLGIGSKNGILSLKDVELVRGIAPETFNKFEIQVLKAISYVYGMPLENIKRETELLGDSLDLVEMVIALEDVLDVGIDDRDLTNVQFTTVQDVLNLAEKHKCRT